MGYRAKALRSFSYITRAILWGNCGEFPLIWTYFPPFNWNSKFLVQAFTLIPMCSLPKIEQQGSCFKFNLNIARYGKSAVAILLYTISGTCCKKKTKTKVQDFKLKFFKKLILKDPLLGLRQVLLSDCNRTRTHNHLVQKRTLNHLTKSWVLLQSHKLQISRLFWTRSSLTFRQL